MVRNEASCRVCGSPAFPENGNAALKWTGNSWIYRKKPALSHVSPPQPLQTAFRGDGGGGSGQYRGGHLGGFAAGATSGEKKCNLRRIK